jgi:NADH-quinone oxidoreductase subunit G
MAGLWIDGRTYEAKPGKNLLEAVLSLGYDLPYFCWHPALGSVGACRQCAVKQFKDENDTRGKLVMACMTPADDGTRISITDPEARKFRASVIEWLMVNHPHDCPVCDEGGECHLQDMTVMTGHDYREYRFQKRTHRNQDLGPFVNHEMNRCISCYRCVRFYREFAGGRDLNVFGAHDSVYFGRYTDGTLQSEFSGNLVEVCPTGVFTDKTLKKHYTRKWDLTIAPSICAHCGLGCNTIPGERYGALRRVRARYHGEVNGYFLCDRGRYGYEFVNEDVRIRAPLFPRGLEEPAVGADKEEALDRLAPLFRDPSRVIGIGSPRASLEGNFAVRTLVGPERFHQGVGKDEAALVALVAGILRKGPAKSVSLREIERADAVLVLGEDATNTAPMLDLALRQAARQQPMKRVDALKIHRWQDAAVRELVQDEKGPVTVVTPAPTKLDGAVRRAVRAAPEDVARLGFAVAHALDPAAPEPHGLPSALAEAAAVIAAELEDAERPVVVAGTSLGSEAVLRAAADVASALARVKERPAQGPRHLFLTVPEANSLGAAMMGGPPLEDAFAAVAEGRADTVVILENDLYRRADRDRVTAFLQKAKHVVVLDYLAHETGARAEVLLPAGTFAEADGTLVNNESRAQRYFQVFVPAADVQESWRWVWDLLHAAGRKEGAPWKNLDGVLHALAHAVPEFRKVPEAAPPAGFRVAGARIPREPVRYSGRTAMRANVAVSEPKPPEDPDSAMSFTMEGYEGPPPPALLSHIWAPGWNSVQSLNKFQAEVGGPLRGGDPGVRLIDPDSEKKPEYRDRVPEAFSPREGEWRVVPLHHIFGSEELSVRSPGVAERAPEPYLALNPEDAARLGGDGEGARLSADLGGVSRTLAVRIVPGLPRGTVGVPVGLPGLPWDPAAVRWIRLRQGGES